MRKRATVVNVSRSGARLRGLDHVKRGDKLQLDVLSNPVDAVALWASSGEIGIAFRPALSERILTLLRQGHCGPQNKETAGFGHPYPEMH
ncbi:hypothetical protein [Yoonia litorea]|nr:hypothetical protein [Yoonia litorea]